MGISNEPSILSGNGEAANAPAKKKGARKSGTSIKDQVTAAAKRFTGRSSEPMEILFTQEPDPHHAPVAPYLWIDHPSQNEILRSTLYSVRLGAGGADLVEISIDKSPWLPCRLTSGFWW